GESPRKRALGWQTHRQGAAERTRHDGAEPARLRRAAFLHLPSTGNRTMLPSASFLPEFAARGPKRPAVLRCPWNTPRRRMGARPPAAAVRSRNHVATRTA